MKSNPPARTSLATKIVVYLNSLSNPMASTWSIADALYENTMQRSNPKNGAIIANIVRASNNDDRLIRSGDNIHLVREPK